HLHGLGCWGRTGIVTESLRRKMTSTYDSPVAIQLNIGTVPNHFAEKRGIAPPPEVGASVDDIQRIACLPIGSNNQILEPIPDVAEIRGAHCVHGFRSALLPMSCNTRP